MLNYSKEFEALAESYETSGGNASSLLDKKSASLVVSLNKILGRNEIYGIRNSDFDLLQFMLNIREIRLRYDPPLVRNFRPCFEPRDSSLQCGAINRPPDED